jgi:sec-independent protein translocase protein TatB
MFDFSWSQIMLIGVVALILIGPKDLPIALRAISNLVKKARAMASEFHTHVDDLMKDADLKDVRDQFKGIRNFDIRSEIEKAVDPDRSIRDTFNSNPLDPTTGAATSSVADTTLESVLNVESNTPVAPPPDPTRAHAPAFIPPSLVTPIAPPGEPLDEPAEPPAFIPPALVRQAAERAAAHPT